MMMVVAMLMKMMMKRERWLEVSYLLLLSTTVDYDANSLQWKSSVVGDDDGGGGVGDGDAVVGDGDGVDDEDE